SYCWGAGGTLLPIDRAIGTLGGVVTGLFVVIVASGFGLYEWVVLAAWSACGVALWVTRRAPPSAKLAWSLKGCQKPGVRDARPPKGVLNVLSRPEANPAVTSRRAAPVIKVVVAGVDGKSRTTAAAALHRIHCGG